MLWSLFGFALATSHPIPATGGIVDNTDAAFELFGPVQYWRTETQGYGGSLRWTNALVYNTTPSNWAWWQVDIADEGDYLVEWYATPAFSVYASAEYEVVADSNSNTVYIDQGAASAGWNTIGTYHFAAGAGQYIAVYDTGPAGISSQHIVADSIRLTRVGDWCGDGTCTTSAGEDCSSCADDCLLPQEDPFNGLDDDCNGLVDDDPECAGQSERDWCVSPRILGNCTGGIYSELDCLNLGQVCSTNMLDCVDSECLGQENDRWCQGDIVRDCNSGILLEYDCATQGKSCESGECVGGNEASSEPSGEPSSEAAEEPSTEPAAEPAVEDSAIPSAEPSGELEDTGRAAYDEGGGREKGCIGLSPTTTAFLMLPIVVLGGRRRKD